MTDVGADGAADRSALPTGSVVPGADIWDWDDDDDSASSDADVWDVVDLETRREVALSRQVEPEWDDEVWTTDAQVVAHADDDGVHDGSRGVEADDDDTTEAFGTKLQRWGASSMLGASLSGMGIGLQKVLNPRDPIQIEIEVDDDSDDRLDPVEVTLGEVPADSVAVLRPWLLDRTDTGESVDR